MSFVVVLALLTQLPPSIPALGAEPLTFPSATRVPIDVVGKPALSWDGTNWVVAWRDTRRLSDASGTAHVYATPWDGGAAPRFPQGLPLPGGASPVGLDDLQVASTPAFTFILFAARSADGGGNFMVVSTLRDAGVTGAWRGTINVSKNDPVRFGSGVLATSGGVAVAGWFVGDEVHLVSVPDSADAGNASVRLDAGSDARSLSLAGIADGGFLVAWVNASGRAVARRVAAGLPAPSAFVDSPRVDTTRVQAVTTPSGLLTTQAVGGDWQAWPGTAFATPTQWPFTDPLFAPLTVASASSVINLYRAPSGTFTNASALGSLGVMNGQVPVSTPPTEPVALAAADDDAMGLMMKGPRVFGVPLAVDYNFTPRPTVTPRTLVPLLEAPVRQRAPSVVWVDPERAFLVAWDEEQVDGGSALMTTWVDSTGTVRGAPQLLRSTPFREGVRPMLLRRPSGRAWGIQMRTSLTERAISPLFIAGGVVTVGASMPTARPLGNAVLGENIELQWGGSAASSAGYAGGEFIPRFTFNGPSPTCAAVLPGRFWFASHEATGLRVVEVDDGDGGSISRSTGTTSTGANGESGVCALATSTGNEVVMAWKAGTQLSVAKFNSMFAPLPLGTLLPGSVFGREPRLVETSDGIVVAWEGRGTAGVEALLLFGGGSPTPIGGGLDVENLAVASSPEGVAALVWDGFVVAAGVRQVQLRLLGRADAGVSSDGGMTVPGDAGVLDGGALDAGVADAGGTDGGALDGGVADAGAADAGALDAGADPKVELQFIPTCGCQGSPAALGIVVTLLALSRLSRRRRANT